MSNSSDLMELKEELIREKYIAAESLLDGFDHTPRLAKPTLSQNLRPAPKAYISSTACRKMMIAKF